MFDYLKKFAKNSMIYGIGNGINRAAAFVLIPLYTTALNAAEFGTLEMFYVTSSVLGTILGMNIAHGTLRFYFEYDDDVQRKQVISTSMLMSIALCAVMIIVMMPFRGGLSELLFKTRSYESFFIIIFLTVALTLSREVSLAYLRAKEKPLLYIGVAILQLVFQVAFNLYAMLVLKLGIKGILLGNMFSIAVTWSVLSFITFRYCGLNFSFAKLKALVSYCLPFVLSAAAAIVINNSDRVFLNGYKTLAAVGIYALALRFGIAVRDLVIEPFTLNFGQARFAIMKQDNARDIYALTMTYFAFLIFFCATGLSVFAREIIGLISSREFLAAYDIVPLSLLPVLFVGLGYIFQTGILVTKKTKYIFYINTCAAVLILALNNVLIPLLGMYGAALSSGLTALFSAGLTFYISGKLFPIKYEFGRLFKIFGVSAAVFGMSWAVSKGDYWTGIAVKAALLASFPFLLRLLAFYRHDELERIKQFRLKIFKRLRLAFVGD